MPSRYVTGTDTGIGKTHVTAALLREARRAGQPCAGMKPVASGCLATASGWRGEDALAHATAAGFDLPGDPIPLGCLFGEYAHMA